MALKRRLRAKVSMADKTAIGHPIGAMVEEVLV
jgi:hypothetical protein